MTLWNRASRRLRPVSVALTLMAALAATPVHAAAVTTASVVGFDHYAGPLGQTTNGAIAALVLGAAGGDLTLAGTRFHDSGIGWGTSVTAGLGVPLLGPALLRVSGARIIGDDGFRAWRAKVGPQFALPGGQRLTLSYAHYRDRQETRSNNVVAEATTTLTDRLRGSASASYGVVGQDPAAFQGSVGFGLNVGGGFDLSAELGAMRGTVVSSLPGAPAGGSPTGLPLLGGGLGSGGASSPAAGSTSDDRIERTLLISLRKSFP